MTLISENIRLATDSDIDCMRKIRMQSSDNPVASANDISDRNYHFYLHKYGRVWVYLDNKQIVGYCICSTKESSIYALFVDQTYQRQGIGRQLLNHCLAWFKQNQFSEIYLATASNSQACHFYLSQGWIICHQGENTTSFKINLLTH